MREVIKADEGYVLTDGEVYGREIYLAEGEDPSAFYAITEEEYNIALLREAGDADALASYIAELETANRILSEGEGVREA